MKRSQFDVIVVGGRVAGASTALLLARAGVRVAVLERAYRGTDTLSTHALMRAGVLQLARWGVLDGLRAAGTPAVRHTTFHYSDGESAHVSIRPGAGVDALYAPRRHLLDRVLADAAGEAGADVRHGTTVTAVVRDDTGRVVGVRVEDTAGAAAELRAPLTVGADGVRSLVARQTAAPVLARGRSRSAILYRYYADLDATGYEWAYGPATGAGFIPTNDGLTGVFVSTTPAGLRAVRGEGADHGFTTLLARTRTSLAGRAADATPVGRLHGWVGPPGFARRAWGPGWALVGDAAYYKDPLTTHGLTDALRDAELLSDEIVEALAGDTPAPVALARYQATRERLTRRFFEATDEVASYAWDLPDLRILLRRVSSAMSDEVDHLWARMTAAAPAGGRS
jgi:flavin-dependent dehydrogenase